jgi:hypothetical protein
MQRELAGKTHGCELMESNMALSTRRQFVWRTDFVVAALCERPVKVIAEARRSFLWMRMG